MDIVGECFRGLVDCHNRNAYRHLGCSEPELDPCGSDTGQLSVSRVAQQFAQKAEQCLSRAELVRLLAFLKNPKADWRDTKEEYVKEQLHKSLTERLESFYSCETIESGQNRERLATPGGPPDSDLGLILHIQSEEDVIGPFWDPRSVTIRLLEEKGLSGDFCFGFNWHWRAEDTFYGRTTCPIQTWPYNLRTLHNNLSSDTLEILPLPFIIAASHCTYTNIRKTLSKEAKYLEILITPPAGLLRFDLDFRNGTLGRLILYVHHPCAGFLAAKATKLDMATQIDIGITFMLWLTGHKYTPNLFNREYSQCVPRFRKAASLGEMYSYVRKERKEQRPLKLEEYSVSLGWVGKYLQTNPAIIALKGESIALAAAKKISRRITEALTRRGSMKDTVKDTELTIIPGTTLIARPFSIIVIFSEGFGKQLASHAVECMAPRWVKCVFEDFDYVYPRQQILQQFKFSAT